MNLYPHICVVDDYCIDAMLKYGMEEVMESARILARNEGKDLTVEHIRLAVKQIGIVH